MLARRHIIPDHSLSHVFFRCHNRQFFLRPQDVKEWLITLWAKHKSRYGIKIYEAIVMDNHAHLLVESPSPEALGHFMRTVNSSLARYINRRFKRDSQAIRERYKSPLVTTTRYCRQVMVYIWLNRFKVTRQRPTEDRYCSAAWRCHPEILVGMGETPEQRKLLGALLDDNTEIYPPSTQVRKFVVDLLNAWMGKSEQIPDSLMLSTHTIGDQIVVDYRSQLLRSMKRPAVPWSAPPVSP